MEQATNRSGLPRYSERAFPAYRYLPFQNHKSGPHPRTDPAGHSYDEEEDYLPLFSHDDWRTCEPYLYGVDLFNYGYWWEAHEALETVWLAAGQKSTRCGRFVQGLIQLAGAQLKRFVDEPIGAQSLTRSGIEKLSHVDGVYLGIEVKSFINEVERCHFENRGEFPRIILHFSKRYRVSPNG
jgi:predicted metal-dependent hydrolase